MMQMARNPSLMNEMMRNTDRQMANIEMMPGGFDALRRMHENIQAPLMDATAGGLAGMGEPARPSGDAAGADNPFASLFQPESNTPSNAPMPNPWAPNRVAAANAGGTGAARAPEVAHGGAPMDDRNAFSRLFHNQPAGVGGQGAAPGMGGMGGYPGALPDGVAGMPNMDPDQMMQMLENPMMQNMMESVLSDPTMVETMIASNPQLQEMMRANPEMGTMLRDPATLRTFLNPGVMRAMMQMRSAIGHAQTPGGNPQANPYAGIGATPAGPGGVARAGAALGTAPNAVPGMGGPSPDLSQLFAIMRGMNANDATGNPAQVQPEPELTQEQLEPQLTQLRDMGFLDSTMCLQALRQARGNVNLAIEHLLSRFGN
jgi:ubiquilin